MTRHGRITAAALNEHLESPAQGIERLRACAPRPESKQEGLRWPGTPGGPCKDDCEHVDCRVIWRVAISACGVCKRLIGFGAALSPYLKTQYAHEACAMQMQTEEDDRRGLHGSFSAGDK